MKIQNRSGSFPCPGAGSSRRWTGPAPKWDRATSPLAATRIAGRGAENAGTTQKNSSDKQETNGLTTCEYTIIDVQKFNDTIHYNVDFDYN